MHILRLVTLALTAALAAPAIAAAQAPAKTGLTMGFPESIGVIWHASDRFALKPEVTLSGSSTDSGGSSDSWNVGVAVTALIYVHTYDQLRTYIAPRFDYGHSSTSVTLTSQGSATSTSLSRHGTGVTGSFGAEYTLGSHFGLFGEAGVNVTHSTIPSVNGNSATGNAWGTRTAVGVILYP
jgi:hypothetical protein